MLRILYRLLGGVMLRADLLPKKLESPLLRLVPSLSQTSQSLLARRMLLATDNTALLRLHQITLGQPTTRVLGRAVIHLCLCPNSGYCATTHLASTRGHYILLVRKKRTASSQNLFLELLHLFKVVNPSKMYKETTRLPQRLPRQTAQIRVES